VGAGRSPAPGRGHRGPGHPATRYLVTNLPRPGGPREADSPHPAASLAEIAGIYGIRNWIEQSYKQVEDQLGWADFQVRSDTAIRRHQTLVNCAFSFCWNTWFADPPHHPQPPRTRPGRGERGATRRLTAGTVLAAGTAGGTRLAYPWIALQRWWPSWSTVPPPPPLQATLSSVAAGHGLHLYIPN
jgi:hypothetical protein